MNAEQLAELEKETQAAWDAYHKAERAIHTQLDKWTALNEKLQRELVKAEVRKEMEMEKAAA